MLRSIDLPTTPADASPPAAPTPPQRALDERIRTAEERAVRAEERVEALERALISRAELDQAKGVLMAMFGLSDDAAFNALVWVSQNANVKVAVIARRFLSRACTVDLTAQPHERLVSLLAELTTGAAR